MSETGIQFTEKELISLLVFMQSKVRVDVAQVNLSNGMDEDFRKNIEPIMYRIIKGSSYNYDTIAQVYMKICNEYLRVITNREKDNLASIMDRLFEKIWEKREIRLIERALLKGLSEDDVRDAFDMTTEEFEEIKNKIEKEGVQDGE